MSKNVGTVALRELAGGAGRSGEGPVEISMRESDFQVIEVMDPRSGQPMPAPANAKVNFTAQSFRELMLDGEPSGLWECTIAVPTRAGGEPVRARVFIDGADIFYVKVLSRLL